jgi:iron complex transport system substrate-binding protein
MRIVSLVPSLTHLIVDLGLRESLVGCTKFCIEPPGLQRTATLCGGTKDPDIEQISKLKPTHVLVNEEENKPEHIAALGKIANVLNTFPKSPEDVPAMIKNICDFLGVQDERDYAGQIEQLLAEVKVLNVGKKKKSFMYFIWRSPWMIVSEDTYISRMLELLGFRNVCQTENRYPEVSFPLVGEVPELIFFSTEPFPFRKRDVAFLHSEWADHSPVLKADGMLCSWYGSMLVKALEEAKKYCRGESQQLFVSMDGSES